MQSHPPAHTSHRFLSPLHKPRSSICSNNYLQGRKQTQRLQNPCPRPRCSANCCIVKVRTISLYFLCLSDGGSFLLLSLLKERSPKTQGLKATGAMKSKILAFLFSTVFPRWAFSFWKKFCRLKRHRAQENVSRFQTELGVVGPASNPNSWEPGGRSSNLRLTRVK